MRLQIALPVLLGALLCAPRLTVAQLPGDTLVTSPTLDTAPAATPPTPEQERYLKGLRTARRGVAQIKDGIDRVVRMQGRGDTLQVRQAGRRLGGLCMAARGFFVSGRGSMDPNAYESQARKLARDLATRLDSLAAYTRQCQREAGKSPTQTTTELQARVKAYEDAVAEFRSATGTHSR